MFRNPLISDEYIFSTITNQRYGNGKPAMSDEDFNASFRIDCHISNLQEGIAFRQEILVWIERNNHKLEEIAQNFSSYDLVKIDKQKQVVIRIPNRALFENVSEIANRLWSSNIVDNTQGNFVYLYIPFKED